MKHKKILRILLVICLILIISSGYAVAVVEGTSSVAQNEQQSDELAAVTSSTGYAIITDVTPVESSELDRGNTYTFEVSVDYDTGSEDPGYFSVSVREDSWGEIDKYVSVSQSSGTKTITITETIENDWDQATLKTTLYPEKDDCPGPDCINSNIDSDEIQYDLAGGDSPEIFQVTNFDPESTSVTKGDRIDFSGTVTNTGGSGTQTVELYTTEGAVDTEAIYLSEGESQVVSFNNIDTGNLDPGQHYISIESEDDYDGEMIDINKPPSFELNVDTNSPVPAGEEAVLEIDIENDGDVQDHQTISISPEDTFTFSSKELSVSLDGGEATSDQIQFSTEDADVDDYSFEVYSDDDTVVTEISVKEPPSSEIDISSRESTVTEGEEIVLDIDLKNVGDFALSQSVEVVPNDQTKLPTETFEAPLDPKESRSETITIPTEKGDAGDYVYEVRAGEETATTDITVSELVPANVAIDSTFPNELESQSEHVIPVSLENPSRSEVQIKLLVDGDQVDEKVTTESSETIRFTQTLEPGDHTIEVESHDEHGHNKKHSEKVTVTGQQPAITDWSPADTRIDILSGEELTFDISANDPDGSDVSIEWFENGELIQTGDESYSRVFESSGQTEVKAVATDQYGYETTHEWNVWADSFRESPRVTDHSTAEQIEPDGTTELITFSVRNPDANDRTSSIELRAETPDGISISGTQNVDETDGAQSAIVEELSPGTQEHIRLQVSADDDSMIGETADFEYEILYYPTENPDDYVVINDTSVEIGVAAEQVGSEPTDDDNDDYQPGFGIGIAIITLLAGIIIRFGRAES